MSIYLNVGSAQELLPGWDNLDKVAQAGVKVCDVRRGLLYASGSVSLIYASQLIEHLNAFEAEEFLAECRRVLEPDGLIRLVTPDLKELVRRYIANEWKDLACCQPAFFMEVKSSATRFALLAYGALAMGETYFGHKHLYDADALEEALRRAGFRRVYRSRAHESQSPIMAAAAHDLWANHSFFMEARP